MLPTSWPNNALVTLAQIQDQETELISPSPSSFLFLVVTKWITQSTQRGYSKLLSPWLFCVISALPHHCSCQMCVGFVFGEYCKHSAFVIVYLTSPIQKPLSLFVELVIIVLEHLTRCFKYLCGYQSTMRLGKLLVGISKGLKLDLWCMCCVNKRSKGSQMMAHVCKSLLHPKIREVHAENENDTIRNPSFNFDVVGQC